MCGRVWTTPTTAYQDAWDRKERMGDESTSWESRGGRALLIGLATAMVPFLITGMFRMMPNDWPPLFWLPFALLGALGIAGVVRGHGWRWLGIGLLSGCAIYAVFLMWLLAQWGTEASTNPSSV